MKKGKILVDGKTKTIWEVEGKPSLVIVGNKNDITENDNPSETRKMISKAKMVTATTCAVFQFLKDAGIPVAFKRQLNSTELLFSRVEMILLEITWRRYAMGSFLNRHPHRMVSFRERPHRFHRAVFELFLKATGGLIRDKHGDFCNIIPNEPETQRPIHEPFIPNLSDEIWCLHHPQKPDWDDSGILYVDIFSGKILPDGITVDMIECLLRRVGLLLEGAWAQLRCRLIDIKIKMGVVDGKLVVADVIDVDNWQLRDTDWNELSKQFFHDNVDMKKNANKYAQIAYLVKQFKIPQQAIVVWRESKNDPMPEIPVVPGIEVVEIILSGHKSPEKSLLQLEKILTDFPGGGVILACIGMSNRLGPVLAARTSWPVIGVPISVDKFEDDVWSSLRMPSAVPMGTILSPKNAILMALNILAQKNPAAYAVRQSAIEDLDV